MKKYIKENLSYLLKMLLITMGIFMFCNIKLPYYVSAPGGVIDISDRIEYEDRVEYDGSLNMLYVTEYVATIPIYLMSYIFDDWDLESIKDSQIGDESMEEINVRNKIMLNNSINNAKYVAYKALGKEIIVSKKSHQVIGTVSDTKLKIGDEILSINDKVIDDLDDVKKFINDSSIGDELKIKVIRDKKELIIEDKIKEIDNEKVLGVILMSDYEFEMNPDISLNFKRSESGSSGGLMMTLSIYSAISGEDILKGRNVAGTGTIDINGNVGEISGVKYKIMGAYKNDMDVVLVPSANYEEAIEVKNKYNYDMEIVSVNTFSDAINYLKS